MSEGRAAVEPQEPRGGARWLIAPLVGFIAVAGLFGLALTKGDPSRLPSALIGKPVPQAQFAAIESLSDNGRQVAGFSNGDLSQGRVSLVNFWASWCPECVAEHEHLDALKAQAGVDLYGVNYKDNAADARRYLSRYGNPYKAVGADPVGRGGIDWGVYGTPETFVINGRGEIAYKFVGPITPDAIGATLLPAIERARAQTTAVAK